MHSALIYFITRRLFHHNIASLQLPYLNAHPTSLSHA